MVSCNKTQKQNFRNFIGRIQKVECLTESMNNKPKVGTVPFRYQINGEFYSLQTDGQPNFLNFEIQKVYGSIFAKEVRHLPGRCIVDHVPVFLRTLIFHKAAF